MALIMARTYYMVFLVYWFVIIVGLVIQKVRTQNEEFCLDGAVRFEWRYTAKPKRFFKVYNPF